MVKNTHIESSLEKVNLLIEKGLNDEKILPEELQILQEPIVKQVIELLHDESSKNKLYSQRILNLAINQCNTLEKYLRTESQNTTVIALLDLIHYPGEFAVCNPEIRIRTFLSFALSIYLMDEEKSSGANSSLLLLRKQEFLDRAKDFIKNYFFNDYEIAQNKCDEDVELEKIIKVKNPNSKAILRLLNEIKSKLYTTKNLTFLKIKKIYFSFRSPKKNATDKHIKKSELIIWVNDKENRIVFSGERAIVFYKVLKYAIKYNDSDWLDLDALGLGNRKDKRGRGYDIHKPVDHSNNRISTAFRDFGITNLFSKNDNGFAITVTSEYIPYLEEII